MSDYIREAGFVTGGYKKFVPHNVYNYKNLEFNWNVLVFFRVNRYHILEKIHNESIIK